MLAAERQESEGPDPGQSRLPVRRVGLGRTCSPAGLELEGEATGHTAQADRAGVQTAQLSKPSRSENSLLMGEMNRNTEGKKPDTRDLLSPGSENEAAGVDRDRAWEMLKAGETGLRTCGNSPHGSPNFSFSLASLQTDTKTTQEKSPAGLQGWTVGEWTQEQEGRGAGRGSRTRATPDSKGHSCVCTCGPGAAHFWRPGSTPGNRHGWEHS